MQEMVKTPPNEPPEVQVQDTPIEISQASNLQKLKISLPKASGSPEMAQTFFDFSANSHSQLSNSGDPHPAFENLSEPSQPTPKIKSSKITSNSEPINGQSGPQSEISSMSQQSIIMSEMGSEQLNSVAQHQGSLAYSQSLQNSEDGLPPISSTQRPIVAQPPVAPFSADKCTALERLLMQVCACKLDSLSF